MDRSVLSQTFRSRFLFRKLLGYVIGNWSNWLLYWAFDHGVFKRIDELLPAAGYLPSNRTKVYSTQNSGGTSLEMYIVTAAEYSETCL